MRALISRSERRFKWVVSAVMLILAFTTDYPNLFTFSTSLKSTKDFIRHGFAIPTSPTLEKYTTAWSTIKIGEYFLNSSIVSIIGVGLVLVVSSLAGFALAQLHIRFRRAIF